LEEFRNTPITLFFVGKRISFPGFTYMLLFPGGLKKIVGIKLNCED
jgi:hypothetical protein